MRLPPPLRRKLNDLIDNEIHRCRVQLGRIDRHRIYKQLKKTLLSDPFYNRFVELVTDLLFDDWCKREVYTRIDKARADYVPKATTNGDLPEALERDTKQPVFVKVPGEGGKLHPKYMAEASDDEHRVVSERREQQALVLLRKSRWHKEVIDLADRHGLSENVVAELFEIRSSEGDEEEG